MRAEIEPNKLAQTSASAQPDGPDEQTFGTWLRQLRQARDLTQEALAEQIGCATQTMRSFENGRRRPSRELVARLAAALQVPPDKREHFLRLGRAPLTADGPPPAPASPPTLAQGAPLALDTLIGRHAELGQLLTLISTERRRLVTLLGPGGVGKTRLATQAASDLAVSFADGAALVSLATLTDSADIPAAIAAAVGCPLVGSHDLVATLHSFLSGRVLLLVLDNLEHLLSPALGEQTRTLIGGILRAAPGVTILATSRERIHLQAEWSVGLAGLGLPADDSADSITHAEAVLLFVERARRISSSFALTPHNRAAIAAICRHLDGLPLAIELAAAQVAFLPPAALLTRLAEALPLLERDDHDVPERQRTMRAAIGWSDDLLRPHERQLFHRLAAFIGPFSLEAAEAVGADGAGEPTSVLALLRRLVDQSLVVRADTADDTARYRLLEPIRQFALERLEADVAEALAARQRHAAFFCAMAETAYLLLRGPAQAYWLDQLEQEYANLRTAMAWLIAQGELATAASFGHDLWVFLWMRGHLSEGQRWMEQVVACLPATPSLARANALVAACVLAYGQAHYAHAAQLAEESLAQYRALDHASGFAEALSMVGLIAVGLHEYERAEACMGEAVTRSLAVGNSWGAAMTLNYWAPIPLSRGDYRQAAELAGRALELAHGTGDQVVVYSALYNLALVAQHEGDPTTAGQHFRAALRCAVAIGDLGSSVACLSGIGGVAATLGDGAHAARLWGAAAALSAAREAAVYGYAADPAWLARMELLARATVAPAAWDKAWAAGQAMTLSQAVAEALREHDGAAGG